jgi:hypothetical protein
MGSPSTIAQTLPQAQPQPTPTDTSTPATTQPEVAPEATPAGSLTALKPATAAALKPTFDKLDAVIAKYGPKAGLKDTGAPVDHYARVQLADQVFKGLASKPAEQKAFLQEMDKAGEAFGINCGLSVPDTAAKLGSPAKAIQSELVGVFLNQKQTHVKAETKTDDPAAQTQTASSTTGSGETTPADAGDARAVAEKLFVKAGVDPKSGVIKSADLDKPIKESKDDKEKQGLTSLKQLLDTKPQGMTASQLTQLITGAGAKPKPETDKPVRTTEQDPTSTEQPVG